MQLMVSSIIYLPTYTYATGYLVHNFIVLIHLWVRALIFYRSFYHISCLRYRHSQGCKLYYIQDDDYRVLLSVVKQPQIFWPQKFIIFIQKCSVDHRRAWVWYWIEVKRGEKIHLQLSGWYGTGKNDQGNSLWWSVTMTICGLLFNNRKDKSNAVEI